MKCGHCGAVRYSTVRARSPDRSCRADDDPSAKTTTLRQTLRRIRRPCARPWPRYWPFSRSHPSQPHATDCSLTAPAAKICSIALQICSSAARIGRDAGAGTETVSNTRLAGSKSTALSSHNFLKPACQHHPSMGSLVAPFPCTSNRRVGYSGRFLHSGVSAGEGCCCNEFHAESSHPAYFHNARFRPSLSNTSRIFQGIDTAKSMMSH